MTSETSKVHFWKAALDRVARPGTKILKTMTRCFLNLVRVSLPADLVLERKKAEAAALERENAMQFAREERQRKIDFMKNMDALRYTTMRNLFRDIASTKKAI